LLKLTGYVDESGHSKDPKCRFIGVGGFVAAASKWERFGASWQSALDAFLAGQPFHMREFVRMPPRGPYAGWDESKRRALLTQLVAAIKESEARPVASVVFLDDYERLTAEHRAMIRDPYYMAFQEVTKNISLAAIPKEYPFVPEAVSMVYAYQEEFGATPKGRAEQLWQTIKKNFMWGQWMGAYRSASPSELLPLQAADLFIYELTREFENWIRRPNEGMRWALKQILCGSDRELLIKLFTFPVIVSMLWNSGAIEGEGSELFPFEMASHESIADVRSILMTRART
jgi:hypothetical protein